MFSSRRLNIPHLQVRVPRHAAVLWLPVLLAASVPAGVPAQTVAAPAFSGARAMELLVAQCDLGPRIAGTPGNLQLREMILAAARRQGFRAYSLCFQAVDPRSGSPVRLCNIVVAAGPDGGDRLWLGAHYDTRPVSDRDPDHALRSTPLIGANDGASGVAVLLHLMEILGETPPDQGVDFLFFDGEDLGLSGDPTGFCLGSRHLAASWSEFGSPLATGTPRGVIVLDMVGKKNLKIPMEAYSLVNAPDWTAAVFDRAEKLGVSALVREPGPAVYDDHVPFLEQGLPALDLIDFVYPQWHTASDTPAQCDAASLAAVGRLMLDLIYRP